MQPHQSPKPTKLKSGEPTYSGTVDGDFCEKFADKKVWHIKRNGQTYKANRVPTKTEGERVGHDRVFGVPSCTECGVEVLFGKDKCDEHSKINTDSLPAIAVELGGDP